MKKEIVKLCNVEIQAAFKIKTYRPFIALLFFFFSFSATVGAQYKITGLIVSGDDTPIKATVKISGDTTVYNAGDNGEFIITGILPGKYFLTIIHPAFNELDEVITVKNKDLKRFFKLENKVISLDSVVVAESRNKFGFTRLRNVEGVAIFAGKKSESILTEKLVANLATNNARQVYSKVAGLNIYENDGGGLQLSIGGRGLDPNRTANFNVRQNGYDIAADALGYPESYYTPPVEALKRIQVVRGAASLQYGTQFGGLLNFEMKQPRTEKGTEIVSRQTAGSYGFFNSFNSINSKFGKFNTYAFFQYKRGDGWRPNSGFEAKTAYADFHYNYKEKSHIGFEITHMDYLAQQPGGLTDEMFKTDPRQSNRSRNWFKVDWNLLCLEWDHQLNPVTKFSLRTFGLLANRQSLGFRPARPATPDAGTEREMIDGDFRNIGAEARMLHNYKWLKKENVLLLGGRWYRGYNHSMQGEGNAKGIGPDFGFPVDSLITSDYTFPNNNYSVFGENIFYLNRKWSLTPGFRFEYIKTTADGYYRSLERDLAGNIINNKLTPEVRDNPRSLLLLGIGISYKPFHSLEIYGNISQNYRSVTFNDIRITNPTLQVDPAIKDEKGYSADIGVRGNIKDIFNYDASLFSLSYGKRIGEVWKENSLIKLRTNVGKAWIFGLEWYNELQLLKAFGNRSSNLDWSIYTNTAIIHSRYTQSPYENVKGKEVEFIPALNIKTGTQLAYKQLKASIQYSYLSSQYTDAQNSTDADPTATVGVLPAYAVMDLSLSYQVKKWLRLEGSINNVRNKIYATRRASGYPGPGLLPADGRSFFLTAAVKL